jgi:glycosyltransferase involved in cell wall biosynthesis
VGGIPEVVTDGETGFLSNVGDVEKMANDAARLLSDDGLRREMGKRARESAVTRYRTDIIIPRYIEFYERVLKKVGLKFEAHP